MKMPVYIGPEGVRDGRVIVINRNPIANLTHEVVERKGIGHPDYIADTLASKISQNYGRYTTEHCDGMVLHHQVDKLMVVGGKTDVTWGGGRFLEPVKVIIAGRVSRNYLGGPIPVDEIIENTVRQYFTEMFPLLDQRTDLIIQDEMTSSAGPGTIRESKGAIAHMFSPVSPSAVRGYEKLVANDTSYCVGYAPYTNMEKAILETEGHLNSPETKVQFPWLGTDIKIMGIRHGDHYDFTACIPQIAAYVHSLAGYQRNLHTVAAMMMGILGRRLPEDNVNLSLNTKDDYEKGNVYLTLTGSSLSGDIGVVGRGNRVNGLITARRPMSLEGASGKNPRYYSGFIYSVLADRMARRINEETDQPCDIEIVAQNGGYLLYPWMTTITTAHNGEEPIRRMAEEEFDKIPQITEDFLDGKIKTC